MILDPVGSQAFADVGYDGVCSLEYERDFQDNERAVIESIAYERGICDAIATGLCKRSETMIRGAGVSGGFRRRDKLERFKKE